MKTYAGLAVYLYICFGAILLYKAAVLGEHGIGYTPYGLAAIKALVLAKFMLLGHAARIGERHGSGSLVLATFRASTTFLKKSSVRGSI